jgi:hypothetical protein
MTDEKMMEWSESLGDNQLIGPGDVYLTKGDDRREAAAWNKFAEGALPEYDNRDPKLMPIRMGFVHGYLSALRGERSGYGHPIEGVTSEILLARWEHWIDDLTSRAQDEQANENTTHGIQMCLDDLRELLKGAALAKRSL